MFKVNNKLRNLQYSLDNLDEDLIAYYISNVGLSYDETYLNIINDIWKYGISFSDYFELGFFKISESEKKQYITTSMRHELTRKVNNNDDLYLLKDKLSFYDKFEKLLGRSVFSSEAIKNLNVNYKLPRIVIKSRFGQAGQDIYFPENINDKKDLLSYMNDRNLSIDDYLYEEYVEQHDKLKKIHGKSLNTLRIVTFNNNSNIEIWGTVLRCGNDTFTDNLATGGFACVVDFDGIIRNPAITKDPLETTYTKHPLTNESFIFLEVPYFKEAIALAKDAALLVPSIKSVGWDIAISCNGPILIEGNDNWCKSLLQLPYNKGMLDLCENVCDMHDVY